MFDPALDPSSSEFSPVAWFLAAAATEDQCDEEDD